MFFLLKMQFSVEQCCREVLLQKILTTAFDRAPGWVPGGLHERAGVAVTVLLEMGQSSILLLLRHVL